MSAAKERIALNLNAVKEQTLKSVSLELNMVSDAVKLSDKAKQETESAFKAIMQITTAAENGIALANLSLKTGESSMKIYNEIEILSKNIGAELPSSFKSGSQDAYNAIEDSKNLIKTFQKLKATI